MEDLKKIAIQAAQNAYVPYSHFKVGAALRGKSGKIYTGCNVENASYGLTNCAERTAVFKAVSEGETEFVEIAIFVDSDKNFPPCGACRQVLSEFSNDLKVVFFNKVGEETVTNIAALLPYTFSLKKNS